MCDHSVVGEGCIVRAGAVVKQRSTFGDGLDIDGFPAREIGRLAQPPEFPAWALDVDELPVPKQVWIFFPLNVPIGIATLALGRLLIVENIGLGIRRTASTMSSARCW